MCGSKCQAHLQPYYTMSYITSLALCRYSGQHQFETMSRPKSSIPSTMHENPSTTSAEVFMFPTIPHHMRDHGTQYLSSLLPLLLLLLLLSRLLLRLLFFACAFPVRAPMTAPPSVPTPGPSKTSPMIPPAPAPRKLSRDSWDFFFSCFLLWWWWCLCGWSL